MGNIFEEEHFKSKIVLFRRKLNPNILKGHLLLTLQSEFASSEDIFREFLHFSGCFPYAKAYPTSQ